MPPFVLDTPLAHAFIFTAKNALPKVTLANMSSDDPKHVSALCAEVDLEQSSVVWIAIHLPGLLARPHSTQSLVLCSSGGRRIFSVLADSRRGSFLDSQPQRVSHGRGSPARARAKFGRSALCLANRVRCASTFALACTKHQYDKECQGTYARVFLVFRPAGWPFGGLLIARESRLPSVVPILQDGAPAVTLTMDDLLESLRDQGVHLSKPGYHVGPADADGKS